MISVQIYPTTAELLEHLAPATVQLARSAVEQYGLFAFALSGGSTPESFYRLLAKGAWKKRFPWNDTVFFWSDERAVGPKDPKSNYRMASEAMLSAMPVPPTHMIRMRGEEKDLARAAEQYESEIVAILGPRHLKFDLILLGMGEDGHTASLFPGTPAVSEKEKLIVVNPLGQNGESRLSFTFPLINRARANYILVTGEHKAEMVKEVFTGGKFPVQNVHPGDGQLTWWMDRAAASGLTKKTIEEYIAQYRKTSSAKSK